MVKNNRFSPDIHTSQAVRVQYRLESISRYSYARIAERSVSEPFSNDQHCEQYRAKQYSCTIPELIEAEQRPVLFGDEAFCPSLFVPTCH